VRFFAHVVKRLLVLALTPALSRKRERGNGEREWGLTE